MEQEALNIRRGSETRQRTAAVLVRLTPAELATATARAEAAGLSLASYFRAAALGSAGPRVRRQYADVDMLRRLLGAVGKVGANVNQLAAAANRGALPDDADIGSAVRDIRDLRAGIMQALGREP